MLPPDQIARVETCELRVGSGGWGYEVANRAAIDAHWARRQAESPLLFNGVIHLLSSCKVSGGTFSASFVKTDFKSFLHWRESGHPSAGVGDCFGSALIRSTEGHVLLGRQKGGQINAGLLYPPSGFIDPSDVRPDGGIDIAGNIEREIAEETGLDASSISWRPGFRIVFSGAQVAIAREGWSPLGSQDLRKAVLDHIHSEEKPELVDVVMLRSAADIGEDMPAYARLLLRSLLADP